MQLQDSLRKTQASVAKSLSSAREEPDALVKDGFTTEMRILQSRDLSMSTHSRAGWAQSERGRPDVGGKGLCRSGQER